MRFRVKATDEVDVNITPLIDVVFLLLIFFMVTTTFNQNAELKVDLPEASTQADKKVNDMIEVIIDSDGRYYINSQQVVNNRAETLMAALRKVLGENKEVPMVIRADARTPHQFVVTAMDSAARLGVKRLSIATTQISASE